VNRPRYTGSGAPGPKGPGRSGDRGRAGDRSRAGDRARPGSRRAEGDGPDAAEIRTQERVRTQQEDQAPDADRSPSEDRIQEAVEEAAAVAEETGGLGAPGRPINRRSPFMIGMTAAFGVAVTYGLVEILIRARAVLILIGLALFIAVGLDPVVGWLVRRRVPRWAAVLIVVACGLGVAAAFLSVAIPPLTNEVTALARQIPHYMHNLQDRSSELGKLNVKYHIQERLTKLVTSRGSSLVGGVLGAGELVLGTVSAILTVLVLSIYFLAGLPRIKLFAYQLVPHSRRPRVILIGDEILAKVGGYVLGNFLTSVIAAAGTFFWMLAFGIPYPILLAMFVALLDLIPVIGSTIGGAVVTLVALTVSLPVAIATLAFYIAYRLAEDYLIVPRIMGRTVQVPAIVSLVAVLIGGVLLGIVGALVAIPAAAAVRLLLHEITIRRLDHS
jgi:predicted PurR-regulated permease PerM